MSIAHLPEKMVILAIDDDRNNLKALTRIFNDYDEYTLHCSESGEAGLEKIEHIRPDLILLDIQMPGMSGYEVCRHIKSNPKTNNIMVLLLSGMASLNDRLQGYEVEADDYLTKPFDQLELFAKIRILLRLKQTQDQLTEINSELSTLVDVKTREVVRKERQALVGQMVLGIIHNLRGPLTSAKGMADLADFKLSRFLENLDKKNEHYEVLQTVKRHLKQSIVSNNVLADMITNILSKGRGDAQKALQEIDLNVLIEEEIDFFKADLFFKNQVEKKLCLDGSLPPFYAVPADFSQLFYNLIRNAVDAMLDKDVKILTITTSCDDESVYIHFQDTGDGFEPGHEKEIFKPFYTTKPSAKEANEGDAVGTGLGLYTCLELVKLYNGAIKAEAPETGGCVFTVTIPRSEPSDH